MSEHTPGPWEFLEAGDTESEFNVGRALTISEGSAPHNDIANVYSCSDATVSITREQAIANAHLIAAAPNLLAIARRWAALDGSSWHVDRHARYKAELLADTGDVIAKATGAQP